MKLRVIDVMVEDYQEESSVGVLMEAEFWGKNIIQKSLRKLLTKYKLYGIMNLKINQLSYFFYPFINLRINLYHDGQWFRFIDWAFSTKKLSLCLRQITIFYYSKDISFILRNGVWTHVNTWFENIFRTFFLKYVLFL